MANKVIRDKSRCAHYFSDKSRFMKQKHNKKVASNVIKQTCLYIAKICKNDKN